MKKSLLMKTMLLLFALVTGSTCAWAADKWIKTAPTDLTTGDIVVLVDLTSGKAMSNNNGTSSAPSAVAVTISEDEITSTVATTIQWTVTASGTGDSRTYQLGSGTSYLYVTAANNGVRVGSGARNTFTIKTGGDNSGYYLYNKITGGTEDERYVGCYNSSNWRCYTSINTNIKGNNNAFFKKVADSTPTCETPTFSPVGGTFISAQDVTISTTTDGATIHYTTDGSAPTTSSSTYSSPIKVNATTTIKAIAVKDGYDNSAVASATYTFVSPYTVSEAIDYIGTLGTATSTEDVFVMGIVSQIDSYNDTYKSITYWISDDGTTTNQMEVYSGKGLNGANFTAKENLTVGDLVIVKGKVKMYNTTPEFIQNNQLEEWVKTIPAVTSAGWATYVTPCDLEFAEGDAYVVSAANASTATLVPVTKIRANQPIILKGEGAKSATVLSEAPAAVSNELAISTGGEIDGFVLAKPAGKSAGFYKWNGGSLTSGKVYLPAPAGAREYLEFSFDGETTSISEIETMRNVGNETFYNLNGQKVQNPTKGLYIVNGKKVIIK